MLEGDGAEIESQLVASAAAGPWVPVSEMRIWIYAGLIGLFLAGMTFVWAKPDSLHDSLDPLTNHLLTGSSPVLVICVEFLFLAMSAQLSHLIGWYRSRGKLDFGGRYRFWPWATGLFAIAAFAVATNTHRAFGDAAGEMDVLTWRGETVAWLLPVCLAALPIALFLDRDIRNCRSSLWTIRLSVLLWIAEAWLEVYRPDLQSQPWFDSTFLLTPLFASASLFVGLWLHARVVAYVCPDPPELNEQSAWSTLMTAAGFVFGLLMFWKRRGNADEDDEKPKRRRKKADAADETPAKRKRKTPAKRTTSRTRTRTKVSEEETAEEQAETASGDEVDQSEDSTSQSESNWDESENNQGSEQWEEEAVDEPAAKPAPQATKGNGRFTQVHKSHGSSVPAPYSKRQNNSWEEEDATEEAATAPVAESSEETDEDRQFQLDSGMTADQMKGLSKRQKRELKKQLRDQERSRGR
jgi:hypothetical protein